MRTAPVWLCAAFLACGGVPREQVPAEPIAFVRQQAAQGLIGIDEFRAALRIPNRAEPETLKPRLTTTLALLSVPTRDIRPIPEIGLGALPLDWTPDGYKLLIGIRTGGQAMLNLRLWNRQTGAFERVRPGRSEGIASIGYGPIRLVTIERQSRAGSASPLAMRVWTQDQGSRFMPESEAAQYPDLSSDGRSIVFIRQPRRLGRSPTIYLARMGEKPVPLGRGSQPRFSRDGQWISFLRRRGPSSPTNVWIMHANGSGKRRITDTGFYEDSPSISPDNAYVVYASVRGSLLDQSHLYLSRLEDREEIQLTVMGQNGRPVW